MSRGFQDMFHSLELAFCGHSGSGKTTLIEKIISQMSHQFQIGYIKHDIHNFEMDHKGKDTYRAYTSGAQKVYINDQKKSAFVTKKNISPELLKTLYNDCDFVLIEGYKDSKIPKVIVLDDDGKMLDRYHQGEFCNVLAICGRQMTMKPTVLSSVPYFNRDNILKITQFVKNYFKTIVTRRPMYGLVLTGGKSLRMQRDKSSINYHGTNQTSYSNEVLNSVCDKIFISCRKQQETLPHICDHRQIHDMFLNIGPAGGILTAMMQHPDANWFVLACDLPFVDTDTATYLFKNFDPYKLATTFLNPVTQRPDPLCCIYSPKARFKFLEHFIHGSPKPMDILMSSDIKTVGPVDFKILTNVNTPKEYKLTKEEVTNF